MQSDTEALSARGAVTSSRTEVTLARVEATPTLPSASTRFRANGHGKEQARFIEKEMTDGRAPEDLSPAPQLTTENELLEDMKKSCHRITL